MIRSLGTIENVEHRVTDADGEEHVVLVTVRSVTIQGGTRLYSVRDVTERKRQETRFQAFVENFSDVMLVLDDDGTMRYVTPSVTRILGYDPDDLQGEDAFARIHPDDRAAVRATFEQLRTSEDRSPVDVEYRYRHADGSWRWLSSVGVRHTELADGDYLVNSRDVTDRVHREQRLRRLEESRSLALQAADAGIWEWDLRTDTVDWDESCERLYGLEPGEFEGTYEAFAARVHPDDLPMVEATLERAVARREPLSVRYRILRDDGGERWVDGRGVVLTDEAGDPERVLGVDVDITEREEYLRQLRVLDTVLRHNFRNDMNVIQGFAETIRATASDPVAGYADRIVAQSDHLLDVTTKERKITDVLASETNLERVDVTSTVRSAVRMARERYPDATVDCDIESAAGVAVTARTELVEAVVELVENAIEHSDGEPRVRVSASVTEETVDVVVSDDGPGIPAVERQLVTGQRDIEPLYHGEGLGLWLVTLVARRSNGTLHFEENDPRGATVRIRLHRAE